MSPGVSCAPIIQLERDAESAVVVAEDLQHTQQSHKSGAAAAQAARIRAPALEAARRPQKALVRELSEGLLAKSANKT